MVAKGRANFRETALAKLVREIAARTGKPARVLAAAGGGAVPEAGSSGR